MDKQTQQKLNKKIDDLALATKKGFNCVDKRFEGVDKRFDSIDKRFDSIDKRFEGVDKKFEQMDRKFTQKFDLILTGQDKLIKKLETWEQEKVIADYQFKKQIALNEIIITALYRHKIINDVQMSKIKSLEII